MQEGVTVVVPVLDRVQNLAPLMESICANTIDPYVMFVYSPGKDEVKAELSRLFNLYPNMEYRRCPVSTPKGDYARKVNLCLDQVFTQWLFTGADDLKFHPNWFENAMRVATDNIHVIGTQDLGNPRVLQGIHSTHTLVRTKYAREFGLTVDGTPGNVLCTGYWHEYCDDELVGVAKKRGIWAFAHDSIVEHMHPNWGKANTDDSYNLQGTRLVESKGLYAQRKLRWV